MSSEEMPVPSITSEIESLKQRQETLFSAARERRLAILVELRDLCVYLGPLTRDDLPEGVLRRRRPRKGAKGKAGARPRATKGSKEKAEEPEAA